MNSINWVATERCSFQRALDEFWRTGAMMESI